MKLQDLIIAVKEQNLSKDQLEQYYSDMANLYAEYQLRLADIRKQKAIFFIKQPEKTSIATERKWQATDLGLEEIDFSHSNKALEKLIGSLKSRIYNVY